MNRRYPLWPNANAAPMPGKVTKILLQPGAEVSAGQAVMVMEAMKMEHPIKAGVDGVIKRVAVSQGDQVKNRQVLVEIEAAEA